MSSSSVRTSHASDWTSASQAPVADAGGPYSCPRGKLRSGSTAGTRPETDSPSSGTPDPQLRDIKTAQPTYSGLDDGTFPLRLVVTDSTGMTSGRDHPGDRDERRADRFTDWSQPRTGARSGIAVVYADPGRLDTHTATAAWGDGATTVISVSEKNGAGIALGTHQYAHKGTYTIKVLVRDDDGGSTEKTTVITLH